MVVRVPQAGRLRRGAMWRAGATWRAGSRRDGEGDGKTCPSFLAPVGLVPSKGNDSALIAGQAAWRARAAGVRSSRPQWKAGSEHLFHFWPMSDLFQASETTSPSSRAWATWRGRRMPEGDRSISPGELASKSADESSFMTAHGARVRGSGTRCPSEMDRGSSSLRTRRGAESWRCSRFTRCGLSRSRGKSG
jgi:hypothetical protein